MSLIKTSPKPHNFLPLCLCVRACTFVKNLDSLTIKIKALRYSETSGTTCPTAQRHIPEETPL